MALHKLSSLEHITIIWDTALSVAQEIPCTSEKYTMAQTIMLRALPVFWNWHVTMRLTKRKNPLTSYLSLSGRKNLVYWVQNIGQKIPPFLWKISIGCSIWI